GPITAAIPCPGDYLKIGMDGLLTGCLGRVPWGSTAPVVGIAQSPDGDRVVLITPDKATITPGRNLEDEPRDALDIHAVPIQDQYQGIAPANTQTEFGVRGALSRSLLMSGAMRSVSTLTVKYANQRRQFGRSIISFQAVAQRLAQLKSEAD